MTWHREPSLWFVPLIPALRRARLYQIELYAKVGSRVKLCPNNNNNTTNRNTHTHCNHEGGIFVHNSDPAEDR